MCFTPNQFFDVVLPYSSRGVVRLVAYIIRMTLGWTDRDGQPKDDVYVTWSELVQNAGIARGAIKAALDEAIAARFIECLSLGVPNTAGQTGSTALYRLRWNPSDEYITDPEKFDGFYEGNANFTYIPNAFYDTVVPNEKLSVIKVVGAIIRNTICWEARRGHRKQYVSMSLSELERRTKQHRETASIGLQEALNAGYLRRDEEGYFDPDKSLQRPATYSLRWEGESKTLESSLNLIDGSSKATVQKSDQRLPEEAFKNPTRRTVQKSDQDGSEIRPEEAFKNPTREAFKNPTSIERTIKNITKQQQPSLDVEGNSLRSSVLVNLLDENKAGFTRAAALKLLERFGAERVQEVLANVSLIGARSKPAVITAALKDGRYEASQKGSISSDEEAFVQAFYASRSDSASSVVVPSRSDLEAASPVLQTLAIKKAMGNPKSWGLAFGQYVKGRDLGTKRIATLGLAIKAHGDDWVNGISVEGQRAREESLRKARQSHEDASRGSYLQFLAIEWGKIKESNSEAYSEFEKGIAEAIERIERSPIRSERAKDLAIKDLNSETGRLERLAEFLITRKLVVGFWEWDQRMNPQGFREETV